MRHDVSYIFQEELQGMIIFRIVFQNYNDQILKISKNNVDSSADYLKHPNTTRVSSCIMETSPASYIKTIFSGQIMADKYKKKSFLL